MKEDPSRITKILYEEFKGGMVMIKYDYRNQVAHNNSAKDYQRNKGTMSNIHNRDKVISGMDIEDEFKFNQRMHLFYINPIFDMAESAGWTDFIHAMVNGIEMRRYHERCKSR